MKPIGFSGGFMLLSSRSEKETLPVCFDGFVVYLMQASSFAAPAYLLFSVAGLRMFLGLSLFWGARLLALAHK